MKFSMYVNDIIPRFVSEWRDTVSAVVNDSVVSSWS